MKQEDILGLLLPEEILEYFDLTTAEKTSEGYTLHLEESNIPPIELGKGKYLSKGFYEPVTVQDFPLRGKPCYLRVKRRRWTNLSTGNIVSRNWDLVATGTRMTKEFAFFLKGINRYKSGKL